MTQLERGTNVHVILEALISEFVRQGPTRERKEQLMLTVQSVLAFCIPVITERLASEVKAELKDLLDKQLESKHDPS